jgi:ligand-binding sensor domain-containing protein
VTLAALRASVFAVVFLALASPAHAQLRFDSWTTENGLPQNSVNDILQTSDGYLWVATFGGLVRFDGLRFTIFDRSVPGIESQRIQALHEDRGGTLWAATEDSMVIRYRNERFTTFRMSDGQPQRPAVRMKRTRRADSGSPGSARSPGSTGSGSSMSVRLTSPKA